MDMDKPPVEKMNALAGRPILNQLAHDTDRRLNEATPGLKPGVNE
jgi:hypothetical protein